MRQRNIILKRINAAAKCATKKGQIGPDRLIEAKMGTQSNRRKVGAHCAQLHIRAHVHQYIVTQMNTYICACAMINIEADGSVIQYHQ